MSQTTSPSAEKPYGVEAVCRVWKVGKSTYYRRRREEANAGPPPRRRGPKPKHSDEGVAAHAHRAIVDAPFRGEGCLKIRQRLWDESVTVCKRRLRRILRAEGLRGLHSPPRRPDRAHNGRIVTDRVDTMWGTDMTEVKTLEGRAYVFVAVDHCSSELVGHHASLSATSREALEPVRMAVSRHMGGFGAGVADGLVLRHDNGANYISEEFQSEIAFFGIESSRSFVRQPQGNGVAERFIRTLKEQSLHGRVFATLRELREELDRFANLYNERWLVQKHGHKTPNQVRAEQNKRALDEGADPLIEGAA